MRTTFDNHFWSYVYYHEEKLVWLKRSAKKLQTAEELKEKMGGMCHALSLLPKPELRLLSDLRDGPAVRNDPSFEAVLLPLREQMLSGFSQIAILARTAVGVLQVNRYNRDGRSNLKVFTGQEEALHWLGYEAPPAL